MDPCVRDSTIPLDDPCADSDGKTVKKSRGYRKIAGDICISGDFVDFEPYEFTCCNSTSAHGGGQSSVGQSVVTGLAVSLALALLVVLVLGTLLVMIVW